MTKTILTAVLIVLLHVLVGCRPINTGESQLVPAPAKTSVRRVPMVEVRSTNESDIVEEVAANREAYRQALELLVGYYSKMGDNTKAVWAERELAGLNVIPQYNYIVEASVAGPGLSATTAVREADYLYRDGVELQKKAERMPLIKDEDLLRLALDKYNEIIRKHPSSDKIDDAAYRAAKIYEYFKDYTIALLYCQRTYQWDPETIYPARFREAFILDEHLRRRAEALEAYKRAVNSAKGGEHTSWRRFAEKRIRELTKSEGQAE